jgi:hypothetical protein
MYTRCNSTVMILPLMELYNIDDTMIDACGAATGMKSDLTN